MKPPLAVLEPIELDGPACEIEVAGDASSLDFLRAVYRDPAQPIGRRMRAAIAALPFEHPKLSVSANVGVNAGFALRLEEARKRSDAARLVIDAVPFSAEQ